MNDKSSGRDPSSRRGPVRSSPHPHHPLAQHQPLASPWWLLGALLGVLGLAAVFVYAAICLLFWQGQWQIVFHPTRAATASQPIDLLHETVRFDATETGTLQLNGWWIPADPAGEYAGKTILFLRDGTGSLPDSAEQLRVLHGLGINLLAFDYRGFGASLPLHPSEKSTLEDADAAWRYLTDMRRLPPRSIVIYGVGIGAALGADVARIHPRAGGLILENPRVPVLEDVAQNPRMRWLPLHLIFQDRFDPGPALSALAVPKLFLAANDPGKPGQAPLYFGQAAKPKERIAVGSPPYRDKSYLQSVRSFLGTLPAPRLDEPR